MFSNLKIRTMRGILLFIFLVTVNHPVFAQDNQIRDGSSIDKAFIANSELEQVINDENAQLRSLFSPKNIRWKIIKRTIKSFGVLNCMNLRRGETKMMHLIEVDLMDLGERGIFYFDISNIYAQLCTGCSDDAVPKQDIIKEEMSY